MSRVIRRQDMFEQDRQLEDRVDDLEAKIKNLTPSYGVWVSNSANAITGGQRYVWSVETKAVHDYIERSSISVANDCVIVRRSGLWVFIGSVVTGSSGAGRKDTFLRDATGVEYDNSLGTTTPDGYTKHKLIGIGVFDAGEKIYVMTNDVAYGGGNWSQLMAIYLGP